MTEDFTKRSSTFYNSAGWRLGYQPLISQEKNCNSESKSSEVKDLSYRKLPKKGNFDFCRTGAVTQPDVIFGYFIQYIA